MYASVTDYGSVYDDAYRAWRGQNTSFGKGILPALVASFCKSKGIGHLLDISGGQGYLGQSVRNHGISSSTTDYGSIQGSEVIKFDLSGGEVSESQRVLNLVREESTSHLSTCFDVLEHIDREHIANAIINLSTLTDEFLVISVSTRPSSRDNLMHSTLAPVSAWLAAFEASGLFLVPDTTFQAATFNPSFVNSHDLRLVNHWLANDLFSDAKYGEPRYFVLQKQQVPAPRDVIQARVESIFDVAYRHKKRKFFALASESIVNFNMHHVQEWSLLRPLLDVLPRQQVRFFICTHNIEDDHLRAIRSFLKRNGVRLIEYTDFGDIFWPDIEGQIVISGAESNVGGGHLSSFHFVSLARLNGCHTILLQHGIWPRPFERKIVSFASEQVLVWGKDEEARLNDRRQDLFGIEMPWGCLPESQVVRCGSPKYADQLIGPYPSLHHRLGYDPARFDKIALFGTKNLGKTIHGEQRDSELYSQARSLIESNPRTLFILRPHPSNSAEFLSPLRSENTIVFDELSSIVADLPLARILPQVDVVITSPSSLILDAAISHKPTIVYHSTQVLEFEGVNQEYLTAVSRLIKDTDVIAAKAAESQDFCERYADAVDENFYSKFKDILAASRDVRRASRAVDRSLANSVSLGSEVLSIRALYSFTHHQHLQAQVEIQRLMAALDETQQRALQFSGEAESLRAASEFDRQQIDRLKMDLENSNKDKQLALSLWQHEAKMRSRMSRHLLWRVLALPALLRRLSTRSNA